MIQITYFSHMRRNNSRKYNSPTISRANSCLTISEINKTVIYIVQ